MGRSRSSLRNVRRHQISTCHGAVRIVSSLPVLGPHQMQSRGITIQEAAAYLSTTDRKSTRLNSSHDQISYAVFCLKKKKKLATTISVTLRRYNTCNGATDVPIPYQAIKTVP